MIDLKVRRGPRKNTPRMKRSQKKQKILDLLEKAEKLNGTDIARMIGKDIGGIYKLLHEMEDENLIKPMEIKHQRGKALPHHKNSQIYEINKDHPRNNIHLNHAI